MYENLRKTDKYLHLKKTVKDATRNRMETRHKQAPTSLQATDRDSHLTIDTNQDMRFVDSTLQSCASAEVIDSSRYFTR